MSPNFPMVSSKMKLKIPNSPMVSSKLLVFTLVLSFLFIIIAIHKQRQLEQLKSRVSTLETGSENREHELQSKEIFEKEIASLKAKIESIKEKQDLSDAGPSGNRDQEKQDLSDALAGPSGNIEQEKQDLSDAGPSGNIEQEWIPVKNQCLTFTCYVKPLFDFLTAKTIEAYHVSKNMLQQLLVKILRSTTPLMQELYKSGMPYFKKISTFLLKILIERLNDLYKWCLGLEAAA